MSSMLKQKLIDIANGFTKYNLWKSDIAVDSALNTTSTNPVQNKVVTENINTLNSNFSDIGKSCCFIQSNTTNITNAFCPVDTQTYNDDVNLYKADSSGVLITKPGTYIVQASFHVLFANNDTITLRVVNSITELVYTAYSDINLGNSKQFIISLSKIVRIASGQERVHLQLLSSNGNSYIFANTLTNVNGIAITKIA